MGWLVCVCVLQKLGINLCKFDEMACVLQKLCINLCKFDEMVCVCVCVAEVRYQSLQV